MVSIRIEYKNKYLVSVENADPNKIYLATHYGLGLFKNRINGLYVEKCDTIENTVQSAYKQSYTDGFPFSKGIKYLYDIKQQIIDENIKRG